MGAASSLRVVLNEAIQKFKSLDVSQIEAEVLLCFVLDKPRIFLHIYPEHVLSSAQQLHFSELLKRRLDGEPLAYIVNKKEFWSLDLRVTPDVLIPRFETELLVEKCLELLPGDQKLTIADLGTGSGAIALALAKERPHWQIVATDYSDAALAVATKNAKLLNLENITFYQGNWCAAFPQQKFAAIISNPPYIDKDDPELEISVKQFEPHSALLAEDNGLADLKKIATQARDYLQEGGWLLLEHGYQQGEAVADYLLKLGYQNVETLLDLNKLPRITIAFNFSIN